ncbi:hypothetical protein [Kineosporia babensis]|uniref:Uncharacterized protein n=1 Tax=Kineosporia babensis TaxID=499548 RepID=A0A9X1NG77_9ACTN|nr:hypothetical protein [Kineosporia babensis]MCD5312726.1 hypothetical protein [Kineosporia babensis]
MSKIDELAELIVGIADKIDEATSASGDSAQEAEQVGSTAAALGAESVVEGMSEVKTQLDALSDLLQGASQKAREIKALALSVAENG